MLCNPVPNHTHRLPQSEEVREGVGDRTGMSWASWGQEPWASQGLCLESFKSTAKCDSFASFESSFRRLEGR